MRRRRSSKLKSTRGSWVSGLSEYEGDIGAADCEARKDDVLAEKLGVAIVVAIVNLTTEFFEEEVNVLRRLRSLAVPVDRDGGVEAQVERRRVNMDGRQAVVRSTTYDQVSTD